MKKEKSPFLRWVVCILPSRSQMCGRGGVRISADFLDLHPLVHRAASLRVVPVSTAPILARRLGCAGSRDLEHPRQRSPSFTTDSTGAPACWPRCPAIPPLPR
jgi:hypothetical protein